MKRALVVVSCLVALGSAALYLGWGSLEKRREKAAIGEVRRVVAASIRALLDGRVVLDCEDPNGLNEVRLVPGEGVLGDLNRSPHIDVGFSCEEGLVVIDRGHGYRLVNGYFEETGGA